MTTSSRTLCASWNIFDQRQGKVDFNFPFAETDSPMRVAQNIGELYEEAVRDTMQLLRYEDLHKAVLPA